MVIFGVKIPNNKKIKYALQSIHGIGQKNATDICTKLGFAPNMKAFQLTEAQISNIIKLIKQKYIIEGNLKKQTLLNIQQLVANKTYRGYRHLSYLPVRGQRTCSNARTQKRLKRFVK